MAERPAELRAEAFPAHEISTVARVVARQVLPLLSPAARADLRELLLERVSEIPGANARWARLELLMVLIRETGEVPAPVDYAARQSVEAALGNHYPSVTELEVHYLGWQAAVREAIRLLRRGSAGRGKSSHRTLGRTADYPAGELRPDGVLQALDEYQRKLEQWPADAETFYDFCRARRDAFIASSGTSKGQTPPQVPTPQAVRRLFGSFDAALWRAQQDHKRSVAADDVQSAPRRRQAPSVRAQRRRVERRQTRRRER